ncbi:glycosyl hydrolase family 3 N terminal domain-containing protein [Aspergillus pseudodeflectus]|uniref:beta-glucosidase n=1 Tax=Aspergillus pseudodeflectus TaxID=176178 RepID=A0ABR4JHB8_9EURO
MLRGSLALLVASLAIGRAASQKVTDDTTFYGQSPPVYPAPEVKALGHWRAAIQKAQKLVSQLTLGEKVNLTAGYPSTTGCAGMIAAIERVDFPGLCLQDAGHGVHNTDFVHSWPSNIHIGASWNSDLAYKKALAQGGEFRRKGVNVMLGPSVGPLGRVVTGGRNWEGYSVDPYLSGILVKETVLGTQKAGVVATTKHYIANEQESYRGGSNFTAAVSSNIDDVTMHELYLWPFQDALLAGTGSIMCSYQRINNSYGCQNSKTLNGILKTELGFQGFVVTDWNAQHSGVGSALAGLDMAMPVPYDFWGPSLVESVHNGSVPESRVDDMVVRILASWFQLGQGSTIPEPGFGLAKNLGLPHAIVEGRKTLDRPILLQSAVEGHVLLKNTQGVLPLKKPKLLSILGYSAKAPDRNMVAADGPSAWAWGFQSGNSSELVEGILSAGEGRAHTLPTTAYNGTIVHGGGSGATSLSTFLSPFDALMVQADEDNTQLYWDFHSSDPIVSGVSDACLVFGNAAASEAMDRRALRDDYTDALISNVARKCSNTIVILHNAGPRMVDPWIDHPNVTAVVFAHLPGQDTGKALVSLLYGQVNFSGKLPYTLAKNESDYGDLLLPDLPHGDFVDFPQSYFSEGVYIDYRHFDRDGIQPRYEFGFGLSYTTFQYQKLKIRAEQRRPKQYPEGPIVSGGQSDLWDVVATVAAEIKNTGSLTGAEAAQLYVGIPGGPVKQLRGFQKPTIRAGKVEKVTFRLTRRDLSVWDPVVQTWRLQNGEYKIYVGSSSRKLPLTGDLKIGK